MRKKDGEDTMNGFLINRRGLLAAGVALPFAGTACAADAPARPARWALVGLGSFATEQIMPSFAACKQSRMTAFVSGTPAKLAQFGDKYGVTHRYNYDSFDEIAGNDEIDCVYILLPPGLHAEYAIRALKAGKHVFCEKPMASTVAECEAMVAAAKAANRQLGVGYRVHFEPNNVEALRRFKAGEIGALRHVDGIAGFEINPQYPPHKWRLDKELGGGGSMYDIGIYALNGGLMYVDESPQTASAVYTYDKADPRFSEVEGGVDWKLGFASGLEVKGTSFYNRPYVVRQVMEGAGGTLTLEPASAYDGVEGVLKKAGGGQQTISVGASRQQFSAQIDAFSQAALTNTPHRTPGQMGLRDIRLIQAIYQSADAGGKLINL